MKLIRAAAAVLAVLTLAGCASPGALEKLTWDRKDGLGMTAAQTEAEGMPWKSQMLSMDDQALVSWIYVTAQTNCLAFKNRQATLVTIGNTSVSWGDVGIAASAAALAKLAGGTATASAAALAVVASQLKLIPQLPAPSGFAPNMATEYALITGSPGFTAMMSAGPTQRGEALHRLRAGLQQACLTSQTLTAPAGAAAKPSGAGGA